LRLSLRPAGQTGPEVALRFETLSSDEAAALTLALRGIEVLRGRLGAGVVGVLSARLLETWGLDADARQLWWGLYRDLSEHPQGPGLLVRAFAAPGDS
jgi:hypothetical protein